jgi:hypothetical protein
MTKLRDDHQPAVVADLKKARRNKQAAEFRKLADHNVGGWIAFEAALKELVEKALADRLLPHPVSHALEDLAKAYRAAYRVAPDKN